MVKREDRLSEEGLTSAQKQRQKPHFERRNRFQQDRDRLLYSTAFRRLGGVTQVVRPKEGHTLHNRLTHTIKVAQLGSRLTSYLKQTTRADALEANPIDEDVVETAAIAHDIGHPPFGHAAEEALDSIIVDVCGDRDGFEGNAQSFRIVTKVARKSDDQEGLDFTRASLNALTKYPWPRSKRPSKKKPNAKKWGYYETEREEFEFARKLTPNLGTRQCVEAQIMTWADDVAYATHDVDDFYRARLIPLNQILFEKPARQEFLNHDVVTEFLQQKDRDISDAEEVFKFYTKRLQGQSEGVVASSALQHPYDGRPEQRTALHRMTSNLITRFMETDRTTKTRAVSLFKRKGLNINDEIKFEVGLLKCLAKVYVFRAPGVMAQQTGHREIVRTLFGKIFQATEEGQWNRELLPPPFYQQVKQIYSEDKNQDQHRHERARIVADYISSMSDEQAIALFQAITGARPSSPLRPIT